LATDQGEKHEIERLLVLIETRLTKIQKLMRVGVYSTAFRYIEATRVSGESMVESVGNDTR